jgi:hypothetical protein
MYAEGATITHGMRYACYTGGVVTDLRAVVVPLFLRLDWVDTSGQNGAGVGVYPDG